MSAVPLAYREALRRELDRLVDGALPELLTWVHGYGDTGPTLVRQPDSIWSHSRSEFMQRPDGTSFGTLPLWTTDESPSDLSAEFEVGHDGSVRLTDLHVL